MRALLTTCLAAAAAMGVAAPADAATYSVSYVVNSNEPTATVQFDDKVQTMRLGWSDMDSTYTASKVFKTTRPTGLRAKIYGGTHLSSRHRVNGEVVVARSSSSVASCST